MEIFSTYSVKIKHYNKILKPTLLCYRNAVDYFISVCLAEWDNISVISGSTERMKIVEPLSTRLQVTQNRSMTLIQSSISFQVT